MAITQPNTKKNLIAQIIEFFKGNPFLSILTSLAFLAVIMPPRKRKAKRRAARRIKKAKRKFFSNPGNPGKRRKRKSKKTKSGKRIPRSVGTTKKTKSGKRIPRSAGTHRTMPEKFRNAKAGTPLMAEKMNWMRSKR